MLVSMGLLESVMYGLVASLGTVLMCISQYTVMQDISPAHGCVPETDGAAILSLLEMSSLAPFYPMFDQEKFLV